MFNVLSVGRHGKSKRRQQVVCCAPASFLSLFRFRPALHRHLYGLICKSVYTHHSFQLLHCINMLLFCLPLLIIYILPFRIVGVRGFPNGVFFPWVRCWGGLSVIPCFSLFPLFCWARGLDRRDPSCCRSDETTHG